MPYVRRGFRMSDTEEEPVSITTVDVYDIASDIGAECEHMIDKYGPDAVAALLPKVINSLELLEALAMRNEKENATLRELSNKITQLECDKIERAEYRQRFEKEMEAIEEQWRSESAELVAAVARLQDENKRLRQSGAPAAGSAPPSPVREQDNEVLARLTSVAEKQRNTLREQESMLQDKQQAIDYLTNQFDRLASDSRDLQRKQKQLQNQMRAVCEERTELGAIVQAQQKDIALLQTGRTDQTQCTRCAVTTGGEDDPERPTFSVREMRAILQERNELKHRVQEAEEQLRLLRGDADPDTAPAAPDSAPTAPAGPDDAPVQGPLPYEPDDAPWKKRKSGISKFFRKFFADSDMALGAFPTLASKMSAGAAAAPSASA